MKKGMNVKYNKKVILQGFSVGLLDQPSITKSYNAKYGCPHRSNYAIIFYQRSYFYSIW